MHEVLYDYTTRAKAWGEATAPAHSDREVVGERHVKQDSQVRLSGVQHRDDAFENYKLCDTTPSTMLTKSPGKLVDHIT